VPKPHTRQIRAAAQLICQAQRPVLYVGGGVLKAAATAELTALAELSGVPVTTTLMALGSFPDSHRQHLGMPGMHGSVAAVTALQQADLIIAVGTRFDDRVTGRLDGFAPHAKVIHADIDPAEIGKNRHADIPILGDAREVLAGLLDALRSEHDQGRAGDCTNWWKELERWRKSYPLGYEQPPDGSLAPQQVIQRIGELAGPDAIYVAGVGQHQMWASQFLTFEKPATWLNSGGAGTMGYAVPAAMGAKAGRPDRTVWAIDGDGCFQMTNQELVTCALNNLPIKVAVINNGALGMVRQWQTLFYGQRYSNTVLHAGLPQSSTAPPAAGTRIPDFVKLAEAMGCHAIRCERPEDLDAAIHEAHTVNDRPVVIDFIVHQDAQVWPMVAAGTSNDDVLIARGIRPDFSDADH
jgi:acetolactate synthase-1/2/3 large subunit